MKSDDAIRKKLFSSKIEEHNDLMLFKILENQIILAEALLDTREMVRASYNILAHREGLPYAEYKEYEKEEES